MIDPITGHPPPATGDTESVGARLFGVDIRGLAFLRIGLALCVLYDLASRAADLYAHYTDYGLLPRSDLLNAFAWLHQWSLSAHLTSGSVEVQALLFLLHAAAALAMMLGYRTTAATFVTWWLTASLQLRNPLIGSAGDALLRMLLLWAIFMPLGNFLALDNLRGGGAATPRRVLSAGTAALLAQVTVVYWTAGYAKISSDAWFGGSALVRMFHDELFATVLGRRLGEFPGLCSSLTHAVYLLELSGPFVLLCVGWFAPLRMLAVVALCLMNLLLGLTLDLGLFPWALSVAVLALMPPPFWELVSSRGFVRRLRTAVAANAIWLRLTRHVRSRPPVAPWIPDRIGAPLREGVGVLLIVVVLHWNVGVAQDRAYLTPWYSAWIVRPLFLQQDWRTFADAASVTGWITMPANLVSGRTIDLMAAGGRVPSLDLVATDEPFHWERPITGLAHYANARWRTLFRQLLGEENNPAALPYGRYLCREWNARYTGDDQLKSFQIAYVAGALIEPYKFPDYAPRIIWAHDCFN
jgi:hypothetical protein